MKVPGVAAVVGGITGGAVQMLQAGVQGVADTADTVQTLAGPVVESVSQSTSRFLGIGGIGNSSNGAPDRADSDGALAERAAGTPRPGSVAAVPALARARGGGRRAGSPDSPAWPPPTSRARWAGWWSNSRTSTPTRERPRVGRACATWSPRWPTTWPPQDRSPRSAPRHSPTRVTRWRSWCR